MPSGFDELAAKIENLSDEIEDAANESVPKHLSDTRRAAQRQLSLDGTNWKYRVWASLYVRRNRVDSKRTRHRLISSGKVAPHNRYVEYGTGKRQGTSGFVVGDDVPSFASPSLTQTLVDNIHEWVETKPVTPIYYDDTRDLAGAIASNVSFSGTEPHPFLRPAWAQTEQQLKDGVADDVEDRIRRAL